MSNVAIFNPAANLPAFAKKGELSTLAKALIGTQHSGKRISVKGGVFRLYSGGKEVTAIDERYLDVVIVAAAEKVSRSFYIKVFAEDVPAESPDCWSVDGTMPAPDAKAPQHANCAQCPKNMKGSGQGESRACRYNQRVAVVLANDMEGDVLQLQLAATSLFGKAEGENRPLQEYARYLTAQGIDPGMLVTRLRFDTTAATPKLFFKAMRWLTEDEYEITKAQGTSKDALDAVTFTVFQQDGGAKAVPALPGTPPKAAAKPAPEPAPEPVEDEEPPPPPPKAAKAAKPPKVKAEPMPDDEAPAPEPTVKKAAKASAPVPSAGLAATLSAWDDE